MRNRIVATLIFAGLMSAVASEEGDAPETVPTPVSPISLKPVEPVATKTGPATEVKPDVKTEPTLEPKAEDSPESKTLAKAEMPAGWDRFKVLVQRNMFSKERGRAREEKPKERKRDTPPVPRIESDLVLIGVIQKDGLPGAIVENRASGKIVTIKPGDSIGAGIAKVISLDSIDFECDGILHVIKIGSTLAGTAPKPISAPSDTPTSTTPGATALPSPITSSGTPATPAPAGGGDSVLERMRRKRQEELRK